MIFVHIGTHKTGSTSIQRCLADNAGALRDQGFDIYHGCHLHGANHVELHLSCLRTERDSFAKLRNPDVDYGEAYRAEVMQRVGTFLDSSQCPHQVFSGESLSWLRFPDELARLRVLLQADRRDINFLLYLRDKQSFATSYRRQIYKVDGRRESEDPRSVCYIKDDSWLLDYDALTGAYRTAFPEARFTVIDYDAELSLNGNVLPSFFAALGVDTARVAGGFDYFLNRSEQQSSIQHEAKLV